MNERMNGHVECHLSMTDDASLAHGRVTTSVLAFEPRRRVTSGKLGWKICERTYKTKQPRERLFISDHIGNDLLRKGPGLDGSLNFDAQLNGRMPNDWMNLNSQHGNEAQYQCIESADQCFMSPMKN